MADYIDDMPQVYFGEVSEKKVDWRKEAKEEDDDDAPASDDVIAMLGFDPDELED